jgi:hypothetical protein
MKKVNHIFLKEKFLQGLQYYLFCPLEFPEYFYNIFKRRTLYVQDCCLNWQMCVDILVGGSQASTSIHAKAYYMGSIWDLEMVAAIRV